MQTVILFYDPHVHFARKHAADQFVAQLAHDNRVVKIFSIDEYVSLPLGSQHVGALYSKPGLHLHPRRNPQEGSPALACQRKIYKVYRLSRQT